ncbi:MAG: DUF6265 family protein [Vicinamibacterales bacterium]
MRRVVTGAALLLAVSAVEAPRAQATAVSALAWMAGSWAGTDGRVEHEEHWTTPKGGAMLGVHRTVRDGRMVEFEFLRIEVREGVLVYLSMPNGRSPATPFTLKTLELQRVVFENLAHDFPQRVIYWKDGDDLRARIEGVASGQERSMEWRWSRAALVP